MNDEQRQQPPPGSSFILHRSSFDPNFIRDALAACNMPEPALLAWFDHNEAFCKRHGEAHYREWLELYAECRKALEQPCGE